MCLGGSAPEVDDRPFKLSQDQALEARIREEARQQRINQGTSFLDALFDGGTAFRPTQWAKAVNLNPDAAPGEADWQVQTGEGQERTFEGYGGFLEDQRQTLLDYYQPQLEDQQGDARDRLKYGLARSGMSRSSEGAEAGADLTNAFDQRQTEMLSRVDGQVANTRARFEDTRSDLTNMLLTTGDAARVANSATTRLGTLLEETPQLNPLGDVFANLMSTYNAYGQGRTRGTVAGIYGAPPVQSGVNVAGRAPSGTLVN